MEDHLKVCINATEECPICGLKKRINDPACNLGQSHDCFEELKAKVIENDDRMTAIKQQFGMQLPNNVCPSGHKLKMRRGKMYADEYPGGRVMCDGCGEKHLEHHELYYHCNKQNCCYVLCTLCAL